MRLRRSKKKCLHCVHDGEIIKQKKRDWNNCRIDPFHYVYYTKLKCCKCDCVAYRKSRILEVGRDHKDKAREIPMEQKLNVVDDYD